MLLLLCPALPSLAAGPQGHTTTVLFTHDLHSHFLPQATAEGGESGGYARLKSAIDRERAQYPDALLVDGGDFSIGSLIQTLYTSQAAELRTMGALGYDATTLGNHEFDHTGTGLASMLRSAAGVRSSGETLPALLEANYAPSAENSHRADILDAMEDYGVRETLTLERGGVTYGLFGLMGVDSHSCAPTSGFVLEDMVQAAQRCVADLERQGAEVIVCLSHAGTEGGKGEDYNLARKVEGIDVIVSGHTHTTLSSPIQVRDTYIVSAGPYCENLGSLTLTRGMGGRWQLTDYHLTPIDETLPPDGEIAKLVEGWKVRVGETYLKRYGLTYDQALTRTAFDLTLPETGVQTGNALGELVSDAFLWAAQNLVEDAPDVPTVTVTADGVLRAPLPAGEITTSMAFDVLSMGVGSDGTSGFPLVGVYLTGKELKAAAEVDASVTPLMPAAQLYMAGLEYAFNPHRMFFNRVTDCRLISGNNAYDLEDGRLYRVVTGMYSAQMLGTVKGKSLGLLSLEPKLADGTPVTDLEGCILRDAGGNEIKEWYALAAYLESFGAKGVPERYGAPDGRKEVDRSRSPAALLRSPNWLTLTALGAVVLVLAGLVLLIWILATRKSRRYGRRRRRYY